MYTELKINNFRKARKLQVKVIVKQLKQKLQIVKIPSWPKENFHYKVIH